ncbi:hypothetical protein G3601_004608 [Salmonella enterica]|nr:hypothetical protein [Salmonella enterica]ECD6404137.1 hypothetical protein [Salmonella enterica subsp. enterica serovar Java]ECW2977725.1 hypothetical protein [Salmonella enterica subsp. diarizonae]EDQ0182493.1 hypothetical protein [Salmonella enterica subsp. enterica serovar 4,[5],12:b:-]EEE5612807.1 hypothetical protein [Salmonella enterica subsp. enterica serovar Typhimurium]EGL0768380.1 hypothetical protein [Salmonella enterica subsp. enterica]HCM8912649.1 hypothetical protein [Salmon
MINFLRKTYLRINKATENTTFQLTLIFIAGIIAGFQAGGQSTFYSLSKEPESALLKLIYTKCVSHVPVAKDIRGPWSTEQMTCWIEELTHVRDTAFQTELYFKTGRYTHECNVKKEDNNKCLPDITSVYKKRLEKYHEPEDLMN